MSAVDALKKLDILSDWTLEERLMLAARMEPLQVAAGTVLLTEGGQADAAFIHESGRLRILSRGEILGVVDSVACFGEISCLLPGTPVTATVMTETPCMVYRISQGDLLDAVRQVPKLWQSLFAQMSDRLRRVNKRLVEILEHSPQGFLKLDRDARVTNEYSRKCIDYLGHNPVSGFSLPEILNPDDPASAASWQSVFRMVFEDVGVPLSDLFDLLTPEVRIEGNGVLRDLRLQFHPILDDDLRVVAVDVGIEDVTRERELERAGELERSRQAALGKIYQNPDSFFTLLRLIEEVDGLCAEMLAACAGPEQSAGARHSTRLLRELHSLKGWAGNFGLLSLRRATHDLEAAILMPATAEAAWSDRLRGAFAAFREAGAEGEKLRSLIDPSLLQRLEGVVLVPAQLEAMRSALAVGDVAAASDILQAAESVEARQLFACWPKDVERLCGELRKQARLELHGSGGRIPKPVFMALDRVLVHALNNAMDHGLEDAEARLCAEKPTEGLISVMVEVGGDTLTISIADDGRGSDIDSALASARTNPAMDQALVEAAVATGEPWRVFLMTGFNAGRVVSEVSGRGVGLDAVANAIDGLGGDITIESAPGQGFELRLTVPLAGPGAAGQNDA